MDWHFAPPRPVGGMERSPSSLLQMAPMVDAAVDDQGSSTYGYQHHVYGRRDPPALIPLRGGGLLLGRGLRCHPRSVARPLRHAETELRLPPRRPRGKVGILRSFYVERCQLGGVEFEVDRKLYSTHMIDGEENQNMEKPARNGGGFLKPQLFSLMSSEVT
ncbi:uncharacterized protein LOC103716309 [Phoenix dactylifera]|uniref:Uncharacterized protein LOC103716309 n=1 Tax=Phoenix dactylifera TaxID=42345 RepID=A0A8B9AUX5_PHODC|nr:uncharacterized protein LOC103716309 [Phoenix dactylifera]